MPPRVPTVLPLENLFKGRSGVREGHLTTTQLAAFFRAARTAEEKSLFNLVYAYGLRVSEAGSMPLAALHPPTIDIVRLKRSRAGVFPLLSKVGTLLTAWLKERPQSKWLFPHHEDSSAPLDKWSIGRMFRRISKQAGLPTELQHPHVLKHSIATHLLASGWDIRRVQEWIGHADIRSTSVYAEVGKELMEVGASEVSKLLGSLQ